MSLRDLFLKKHWEKVVAVPVDEETFYVKSLNGTERAKLERVLAKLQNSSETNAWLVVMGACDEQGRCLFQDSDYPSVMALPTFLTDKIALAVMEVSGMLQNKIDEAKKKSNEGSDAIVSLQTGRELISDTKPSRVNAKSGVNGMAGTGV